MIDTNRIRGLKSKTEEAYPPEREASSSLDMRNMEWPQRLAEKIAAYPLASIGVGIALGVMLGWIIKRK
jgi:hypothetical protein